MCACGCVCGCVSVHVHMWVGVKGAWEGEEARLTFCSPPCSTFIFCDRAHTEPKAHKFSYLLAQISTWVLGI